MVVAFILTAPRIVPSDGVASQAMTWKKELEDLGYHVKLINMWEKNDWKSFSAIILFGFNDYLKDFIKWVSPINPNIIVAPIFDPNHSLFLLKTYSLWGCNKLYLSNSYHDLRSVKNKIRLFLVRSEFERYFVSRVFGISSHKCVIVPLSHSLDLPDLVDNKRDDFCLHISLLCDSRKNVKRLIDASQKYNFRLVLCGLLRNDDEKKLLKSWLEGKDNVEYKGFVSKEEMYALYSRARVFALPSTYEGVGIVALDAAAMGCDIVITKLGGPKEYYKGQAIEVDPYNMDNIGKAVKSFMNGKTYQPALSQFIRTVYSTSSISTLLDDAIQHVVGEN